MIIFHPEVHIPKYEAQKEIWMSMARQGKIILLMECREYDSTVMKPIQGFETLDGLYPETILCSTYTMSQVPFITLKEGGNHSIAVLVFFLLSVLFFPELKTDMESFSKESWFQSYDHFIQDVHFSFDDYENSSDNMKTHIRKRAKLHGGLPSHIPYEVIRNVCLRTIQTLYPNSTVDDIVIQKTLIEREDRMAKNIIDQYKKQTKDIHVCIGAGHLMPFLDEKQKALLDLDIFFTDYHSKIKDNRLLHHLHDRNITYRIDI